MEFRRHYGVLANSCISDTTFASGAIHLAGWHVIGCGLLSHNTQVRISWGTETSVIFRPVFPAIVAGHVEGGNLGSILLYCSERYNEDGESGQASVMMLYLAWLILCLGFLLSASGLERPAPLGHWGNGQGW